MTQDQRPTQRLDGTNIRSFACLRKATMAQIMQATRELDDRGKELRARMLAAAPEQCQGWLLGSGALDDLLMYGQTHKKYRYDDCSRETCGLGMNTETVRANLHALSAAWHNQVAITIVSEEPRRITVELKLP